MSQENDANRTSAAAGLVRRFASLNQVFKPRAVHSDYEDENGCEPGSDLHHTWIERLACGGELAASVIGRVDLVLKGDLRVRGFQNMYDTLWKRIETASEVPVIVSELSGIGGGRDAAHVSEDPRNPCSHTSRISWDGRSIEVDSRSNEVTPRASREWQILARAFRPFAKCRTNGTRSRFLTEAPWPRFVPIPESIVSRQ